jgi:AcrR family transcriptional regulator
MRTRQDKTRQRIVDAAYESFWRSGFARTSLDGIAARAGLTKRTLYGYFRSKDDPLTAVLQQYSDLAAARLQRIADRLPPDADGLIDSFFSQLAGWATSTARWSGSGLTRLVVELADLAGHPARAIARGAKKKTEAWLRDRLRTAGRVAACRPSARYHAADGRSDGADAHSRRQALHRCRRARRKATHHSEIGSRGYERMSLRGRRGNLSQGGFGSSLCVPDALRARQNYPQVLSEPLRWPGARGAHFDLSTADRPHCEMDQVVSKRVTAGAARHTDSCCPSSPRRPVNVLRSTSKMTAVDQPNNSTPFIAVIGPSKRQRSNGITSP